MLTANTVKTNKVEKRGLKETRTEKAELGRKQKAEYQRVKAFAIEREKQNFSKLFIIHEKDNWWKMVGHSAIIFHYEIGPMIGMRSNLVDDKDFDLKSKDGVVNIKNIVELSEKLESAKIFLLDLKDSYRVYNIGKKFTSAELNSLKKKKEQEWAKVNKIVVPEKYSALLFSGERELIREVYFMFQKQEKFSRGIVGRKIFEKAEELMREYSLMANGVGLGVEEYLELVRKNVRFIVSEMAIVSELRLSEPERIFRVLRVCEKIRRDTETCQLKKAI